MRTDDFNIQVNVCMYLLFGKLNLSLYTMCRTKLISPQKYRKAKSNMRMRDTFEQQ